MKTQRGYTKIIFIHDPQTVTIQKQVQFNGDSQNHLIGCESWILFSVSQLFLTEGK